MIRSKKTNGKELIEAVAMNVRKLRITMGLSQEELAEICGYHRTYIGSVERSERNITLSTLVSLSKSLNVSPIDLLNTKNG